MKKITGGCLCGKVRYHSEAEPLLIGVCHCTHCQKQSGSAFSVNIGVPTASLKVEGEGLVTFDDKGDSGNKVERRFCSHCGSPLISDGAGFPGVSFVKAGTLDDPSWVKPGVHIWCASKQPWVTIEAGVPQVPANP